MPHLLGQLCHSITVLRTFSLYPTIREVILPPSSLVHIKDASLQYEAAEPNTPAEPR